MKHPMLAQRRMADINGNPGLAWAAAMRAGDFRAAWAVSDAVLAARSPAARDDPRLPFHERWVWDGQPFDGRRVLVRCYHGLGDTLQFCRFLLALRARAANVTVEAQPELVPLLRAVPGIDRFHAFDPAHPLPPAERDVEIMELCHALKREPDPAPFLRADPLPSGPAGGVGLCWAAGNWNPARSIEAALLRPVARLAPRPVSLQRGPAAADARLLGAVDPLDGSPDVGLTARLLAGLDAVVTVDTMVAHLAGALGRPAFVLLEHEPDWRWGTERCAWYSTVRTVRQPGPGDWPGAVAALLPMFKGTLPAAGGS